MDAIQIIRDELAVADALADLIARRRIPMVEAAEGAKAPILVCSAAFEAKIGGPRALVEKARSAGAQKIILIDESVETVTMVEDLGGRLIRYGLPKMDLNTPALQNGALLALADMLGTQSGGMVAADIASGRLIDMAMRVGRSDVTVFVNGPTGSGKEVLARLIHGSSRRAAAPFVAINCAAIPENMLEAILFGHEKGAFTGASTANKGIVRAADGGTLLLDEISEMPMGLQAKLLRVLQEKMVTPLGSQKEVPVDIRVIATSNRDMINEVRAGNFREDLYYRLNVFPLSTLPLAGRPDDIPALAVAMIRRHTPDDQKSPILSADACHALMDHDWPGNVRELENVVQRALVLCDGERITAPDIMIHAEAGLMPVLEPSAGLQLAGRVA